MCNELKINKSKVNYNTYWDLVVQPFINTNWANEANPKSDEDRKIFNYRIALLDCIYYKWT